ncbi:DinB family protein [Ningiella sp. W23]|uniref:DinB family protein n=1 Tax=Ningiella sp. W23 TaxID=3023715 RepID=UPI003756B80E
MSNSYSAILEQAILLLENLSRAEYQKVIKPHFPSSIGAHMRHVIDHFVAIQSAMATHDASSLSHINYNVRHRHNEVEQSPNAALEELEQLQRWLNSLSDDDCKQNVRVTTEIDISHTKSASCESTLERELIFVSSHAIHHYALIRIICAMQDKTVPEYFGYAPATITHLTQSA